jgi:lipopolysaccharide heptosyltransferase II
MKILLICLSGAGDVLMTTPAIEELRKKFPSAGIDYLVMQGKICSEILKNNPFLNKIIHFDFRKEGIINSLKFISKLRKEKYDFSISFYPQARYHYSIVSYLIGAKKKIGFRYSRRILDLNALLFNKLVKEDFSKHVVENNLEILKIFDKKISKTKNPKMYLDASSRIFAKNYFKKNKINSPVILHAGSGITKNFYLKRWKKEKFADLARMLVKKDKVKIILVGGPEEAKLNEEIVLLSKLKKNKEIFLLQENLLNVAAIIEKSLLTISNDSVIGHLSAAVDTPVISLFGPTCPINTSPYSKKTNILCKRPKQIPPYRHGSKNISKKQAETIDLIKVEEVYYLAKKILK